jgi:hypothetical protein
VLIVLRVWGLIPLLCAAVLFGCVGCANMGANVRSRAARDLSCREADTRVVDAQSGVYRVTGCGLEASYHCAEDRMSLNIHCQQLYVEKQPEPSGPKSAAGASLAKSQ